MNETRSPTKGLVCNTMLDPKEIIGALIALGALELDAFDSETGQLVYKVTDKLGEIMPELYEEISSQAYKDTLSLWEKGLITMNVTDPHPVVAISEFGLDRNNWKGLSDGEFSVMNTIMRLFEGGI
jgi:hypothetical protein